MPDHRDLSMPDEEAGGHERRVVEVNELESRRAQRTAESPDVRGERRELEQRKEPAPAAVRRGPDMGEARDGTFVHLGARGAEERRGRSGRAVDVRLEVI
jgi:hypothetical protein